MSDNNNKIKIVYDERQPLAKYYFGNDDNTWTEPPASSALSREWATKISFTDDTCAPKVEEVLRYILDQYGQGTELIFSGKKVAYGNLCRAAEQIGGLSCSLLVKRAITVVGLAGCGKTSLIECSQEYCSETKYAQHRHNGYDSFQGSKGPVVWTWYELNGITLRIGTVEQAKTTLLELAEKPLNALVYCIGRPRIESWEYDFLQNFHTKFPDISIVTVLTQLFDTDAEDALISDIRRHTGYPVFPVLTREFQPRGGVKLSPYGVDKLVKYLLEG